jgi:hypothetical protein
MNFTLKSTVFAMIVAATQAPVMAYAQTTAATVAQPTAVATKPPIQTKAPEDWIVFDETTYTPVLDSVSRHLDAARKAFDAKDNKKAAAEMRAVGIELKQQAFRAHKEDKAQLESDKALLAADKAFAQDTTKHMNASAAKVSAAADAIESGKINSKADLDKAIGKAARADIDRRWLVSDVTTWYPVSEEHQHHFTDAVAAYAKKDYKAASVDIRKATGYMRLEAARASGEVKQELDNSVAELDTLAASVEKGAANEEQSMAMAFAKANHVLALEHRVKAGESFTRKAYDKAGYELKASAHDLESAAGWVGGEAKAGVSATVTDTRALGDKLASGGTWTRNEIANGLESLGNSINTLGQKISGTK